MRQTLDLSGPLYEGMWSYNVLSSIGLRLPEFEMEQIATLRDQGYEAFRFVLGSLTGTYLETGAHMLEGVRGLSAVKPSEFVRPAVVCHLPRKGPDELIHEVELEANCPSIQPGDALLIDCGWGSRWRSADYVAHGPAFHRDCLPWLLAQPISILGVDVPCIETARSRPDGTEETGNMLIPIFQKGVLLLAPLVNLDSIRSPRGDLIALPLNVEGVSGAPCRAVFFEG